jgi:formylglycine-generating enzyme required for sulfatase activity/serine/threonine protein kinase
MRKGHCNSCGSELPDEAMFCHKCGQITDDPTTPADFSQRPTHTSSFPPELREFYEGSALMGVSKFARVFGAKRKSDGKWVALKVPISPDTFMGEDFIKATTSWKRLLHHNVARLYGAFPSPVPYLEMELCESGCLDDIKKPLPKAVAATIVFDISKGLRYAHSVGITHMNLSQYNILLKNGVPKITDWGLSRALVESKQVLPHGFSLNYAAPEQLLPERFGHPDERTDVYQLGVMFYELVTGELPPRVEHGEVAPSAIQVDPVEVSKKPSLIDPGLKDLDPIITKAMAKEMSDRYQDMDEFCSALLRYLKLEFKQSLEFSVNGGRPELLAYYCSSLVMVHAQLGDVEGALKYAINLKRHAPDRLMDDVDKMIGHLEGLHETGMGMSEEFFKRISAVSHEFGAGKFTWTRVQMKERLRREEWERQLEDERRRKEEAVRRRKRRVEKGQRLMEESDNILGAGKRKPEVEGERRHEEEQYGVQREGKPAASSKKPLALLALVVTGVLILGAWWSGSGETANPLFSTNTSISGAPAGTGTDRTFTSSIGMEFILISSGEFDMGSPLFESGREPEEGPVHRVNISTPFYMGKYEVTQKQWKEVMGDNPSYFKDCGDDCPVEQVSWNDVQEFVFMLNEKEGTDKYRLPTEAEWEYAARAGTGTRYSFGDDESKLGEYAWYSVNSGRKTHPVGEKKPNPWGMYDLHGNVWEWTQDRYGDYSSGMVTDPTTSLSGHHNVERDHRVTRSGSWSGNGRDCRVAHRHHGFSEGASSNEIGFRLIRSL